jgi:hypothetical protein
VSGLKRTDIVVEHGADSRPQLAAPHVIEALESMDFARAVREYDQDPVALWVVPVRARVVVP